MKADSIGNILSIDIGGSKIKASVLNSQGEEITEFKKVKTPAAASPKEVISAIEELTANFEPYDKISVGFPGYVKNGVVYTAHNLGTDKWNGIPFGQQLAEQMDRPVRLLNDADMQGLGVIRGIGFEMVITLGTGFGTAFFANGNLLPHLELAHHPFHKGITYDKYIGKKAFKEIGSERWNKRVQKVLKTLHTVFNYDHLYVGGGNSKEVTFKLDKNITLVSNEDGIKGGAKLWMRQDHYGIISSHGMD